MKDVLFSPSAAGRIPSSGLAGTRVLIVEDSPENRDLFAYYLETAGAEVVTADDGKQGLDKAIKEPFDVVLIDIQMPQMDGYQVVGKLRQKGYLSPVIALTAHAMDEERERCRKAGFDNYLTKPVEPSLLVETVKKMALEERILGENVRPHSNVLIVDKARLLSASPKVKSIVSRFVSKIPAEIDGMKQAARESDWEKLKCLAHKFQGTAGNCGFPQLMCKASELEDTIRKGKRDDSIAVSLTVLEGLGKLSADEFNLLQWREGVR